MLRLESNWLRYGMAAAVTGLAVLLYFLSGPPDVDSDVRYFGFILAVLITALLAGLGPGLLATGLAAFTSAYLLLPPVFSIQIASEERTARLILFAGEGVLLSFVGNTVRNGETADMDGTWLRRYFPALLFVATATGLKFMAYRDLEKAVPFTFFYAATAASAWAGGFVPGLLATALATLSARYFFIEPRYTLAVHTTDDAARVAFFVVEGILLAALSGKYSKARRIANDALALAGDYSRRMKRSIEDLRALRITTRDVIWEWNPSTDKMVLGATEAERPDAPSATLNLASWLQQIHPDDRKAVEESLKESVWDGADEWACEYRKLRPGGKSMVVSDRAYIVRNPLGKALRLIGRRADISDAKRESRIFGTDKRYRTVFEQSPLAILLTDQALHIATANHAATVVLGYTPAELVDLSMERLFEPNRQEPLMQALLNLNPEGHAAVALEEWCVQANGNRFRAKINAALISDLGDGSKGWVVMIEDIETTGIPKTLLRGDTRDV